MAGLPVPKAAIDLFEEGYTPKQVHAAKVLNSNGVPAAARTIREWHKAWRSGYAEVVDSEIEEFPEITATPQVSYTREGMTVVSTSPGIRTLDELIKEADVDMDVWRVDTHKVKFYQGMRSKKYKNLTYTNSRVDGEILDEGDVTIANMCSIEAKFVLREEHPFEQAIDDLLEKLKTFERPKISRPKRMGGSYLFAPFIFDPHWGKRSVDGLQTLESMKEEFLDTCEELVARAKAFGYPIGRVLFVVGNDIFHIDNLQATTTLGTPQDITNDPREIIAVTTEVYVRAINIFAELAPVDVMYVPSNHDRLLGYFLGKYLEAWFHDDEEITFNLDYDPRKYYLYGVNLFGFYHGDGLSLDKLSSLMAIDEPILWSQSKYREWILGHLHGKRGLLFMLDEEHGIKGSIVPALCRTDNWHYLKAFYGNHRAAEGRLYHEENGMVASFNVLVEELNA